MESIFLASLVYLVGVIIVFWTAGAIFFDAASASWKGAVAAVAWIALALGAFVLWQPVWKPFLSLVLFEGIFVWWWFSLEPSHFREWDRNFSRLPSMAIEGDMITIEGVRNTEYRSIEDCMAQYETRSYHLSNLRGADLLILEWGSPWMCHPMFVFDFGCDGRVCISIEVRYRVGQKYSLLRSLYRQQELMFVVSDERDAILRRTKWLEGHDLYLYHVRSDALALRRFFFEYANSINALSAQPRWYHGLTTNCTTSIYAQGRGHIKWDRRMLFNGALDRMMYDRQLLDQNMPFDELKKLSRVNNVANEAPLDDFGDSIRRELPGYCQAVEQDRIISEINGRNQS
jgi:hypothetical protein